MNPTKGEMTTIAVNGRRFPGIFGAAATRHQPILLALTATWFPRCTEMDAEVDAEPPIATHLANEFVPVAANVDRRIGRE